MNSTIILCPYAPQIYGFKQQQRKQILKLIKLLSAVTHFLRVIFLIEKKNYNKSFASVWNSNNSIVCSRLFYIKFKFMGNGSHILKTIQLCVSIIQKCRDNYTNTKPWQMANGKWYAKRVSPHFMFRDELMCGSNSSFAVCFSNVDIGSLCNE